jgi:streptogramin lyase
MTVAPVSKSTRLWLTALLCVLSACLSIAPTPPPPLSDCWSIRTVQTWIDQNQNGVWDPGEVPLENVKVSRIGSLPTFTNAKGETQVISGLTSCPPGAFQIAVEPPANYRLTTPAPIWVDGSQAATKLQFGFVYTGVLTPTPRPESVLACTSYRARGASKFGGGPTEMAVAPDGAIWVATNADLVARFDPVTLEEAVFTIYNGLPDPVARSLAIAPDGTVWVGTSRGIGRFDGTRWTTYAQPKEMMDFDSMIENVTITRDGRVWFLRNRGDVLLYDPSANHWESDVLAQLLPDKAELVYGIQALPDGSLLIFARTSVYKLLPIANTGTRPKLADLTRAQWEGQPGCYPAWHIPLVQSNGMLWMVSPLDLGSSLGRVEPESGRCTAYTYANTGGAMHGGRITGLAAAPDQSLWIGLAEGGATHFIPEPGNGTGGKWIHYSKANGLVSDRTTALAVAPDGHIWIGNNEGTVARCVESSR